MKIAVIDMGTNTFHLLIVDVSKDDWEVVYREKSAVRIGKGGINEGKITSEAEERAINTLKHFKTIIEGKQSIQTFATATSAIRNAKNGQQIADKIEAITGIHVNIISGLQEAEHIYFGVTKALDIGSDTSLIMDIGGGSIEFIIGTQQEIFWKQSFELGGQRLVEIFHKEDPMPQPQIDALFAHVETNLKELFDAVAIHQPKTLIGSSGTFDTLSDIYCIHNHIDRAPNLTEYPLTIEAFEMILKDLISKNREERLQIPGMIALRVDMIVVACLLIDFIIQRLDIQKLRVSAYALKEGVLLKTLKNLGNS